MTEDTLKFSLELISISVEIGEDKYVLKEATGEAAAKWRNAVMDCAIMSAAGKPKGVRNLANTEALLISLCMFTRNGNLVDVKTIRRWPSKIVTSLFEKVKEISGLGEDEDENEDEGEAKNSSEDMPDGFD